MASAAQASPCTISASEEISTAGTTTSRVLSHRQNTHLNCNAATEHTSSMLHSNCVLEEVAQLPVDQGVAPIAFLRIKNATNAVFARGRMATGRAI
jgi:hypothetical protein